MKNSIIELSQKKTVAGRRYIKWVIHEIHTDPNQMNKNGIHWKEQYVLNNIESAKGMPICAEFLSEWNKDEPLGHGFIKEIKDGQPFFENSVVVGVTENAYIEDVEVNGEKIRALIGEGYLYEQRYPAFINWLKSKMFDNEFPDTSVEICAKKDSGYETIIYESGWKEKGRIPMIYDYSGDAIISVEPSDDNAVLLELNQKINNKSNKEDKNKMEKTNNAILELSQKLSNKESEINSLQTELNEFKEKLTAKENKIAELNSELKTQKENFEQQINDLTTELNSVKETVTQKDKEIESFQSELNELRAFKEETVKKELISELNSALADFTEEEKSVAKDKIEAFSSNPSKEAIAEIVTEINTSIAKQVIEQRKKQTQASIEQNSKNDIYGDIFESNSSKEISIDELY